VAVSAVTSRWHLVDAALANLYDECYGTFEEAFAEAYGHPWDQQRITHLEQTVEELRLELGRQRNRAEAWKQRALGEVA
jgi:hypothetical protein